MIEYIEIIFFPDNTTQITIKKDNETIVKKCCHAGKTMVWMAKTGNNWTWIKDLDTGNDIAIFEK